MLKLSRSLVLNTDAIQNPNLTDRFDKEDLVKLGHSAYQGTRRDDFSRVGWMKRNEAAIDLAMQVASPKTFPWPGASNVIFPLITIAALQFSARSYGNLVQGTDIVRYRVIGDDPQGAQEERATRIGRHMSWQVLEQDMSWEEQHDRLLINLAIVGTAFVKTYFSSSVGHNVSELVMAKDLIINYFAKSVEQCPRKTQIIQIDRNEIYERVQRGMYADVLKEPWFNQNAPLPQTPNPQDQRIGQSLPQSDETTPYTIHEQHCFLDLDQDGYAEPYVLTYEESTQTVLRIVSRIDHETQIDRAAGNRSRITCIRPTEYYTKYSFVPSPDGGIYDVGFGSLLGPINESVNTSINQLIDSGTMANSNGGFLARGAKIRGGTYSFAPWEWKRIDSTGDDLRKSIVPLNSRDPSPTLFNLLNFLVSYADRVAGTVDQVVGISPGQNTPAETSRNVLEQGLQVYSTIFKRVWRSMKEEFKKLHHLNGIYLPASERFGEAGVIRREDYRSNPDNVCPVADPNIVSAGMRIMQAQALAERAMQVPGYDPVAVERNYLRALRIDPIDKFYPGPEKIPPGPDPKIQLETLKLKGREMQLQHDRWKTITQLMADRELTAAKILDLRTKAAATIAGMQAEQAAQQLEAFNMAIDVMERQQTMLTERIQALKGEEGGQEPAADGGASGGIPGMEESGSDQGVLPSPEGMGGESEGSVGE